MWREENEEEQMLVDERNGKICFSKTTQTLENNLTSLEK